MSETENAAGSVQPSPEALAAAERERVERDRKTTDYLRTQWGQHDSDIHRGLAANELAAERLGLTDADRAALETWVGRERALEIGREAGEALATIDPSMTPAEARVRVKELQRTPGFLDRLREGGPALQREWSGLVHLAARAQ